MRIEDLTQEENDRPPSRRWVRLVRIGAVKALEMRAPDSGQDSDPAEKPRHQYVVAGGRIWTRRLPPESVGDEWRDGPARWEILPDRGRVRSIIDEFAGRAHACPLCVVRRLPEYPDGTDAPEYRIRGKYRDGPDVEVLAGPVTEAWWGVPLPPCPDCGGDIVWYEAGYVPGVRKCLGRPIGRTDGRPVYDQEGGCGSMFTVDTR